MKILQIHNLYQSLGGEEAVVNAEKKLLEAKGHAVRQYLRNNDELKKYTLAQKIGFFSETIYSSKTVREIGTFIADTKPDIAHVHNVFPLISPSVYYCLNRAKIPIVQTVHNFRFLCPNSLFYSSGSICERCKRGNTVYCLLRRCYKDSFLLSGLYALAIGGHRIIKTFDMIDAFITVNNFLKTRLVEQLFSAEKIFVVRNFIDSDNFRPSSEKEDYAVFIGRLSHEKGLFTLLKALQKIGLSIRLKIAGSGPLQEKIRAYIEENGLAQVELIGFVSGEEKSTLLQKARFSIIPSECYENFPMAILESYSVGTPVIASRIGGLPELVEDGRNGILFTPGDADDLAEKILYLHKNPDKALEMGRYAHKCAIEKYGAEKHYADLLRIYREAIENKRKGVRCCLQK